MRFQLRPRIDGLEERALLSHLAASLMAPDHAFQAEVRREVATSKMAVSLTTNQTTYTPGQVVQMTLTMTNTSSQNETVALGPSIDGFFVTQNAKVIWRSNSGVEPQYIVRRILKPGQSITLTAQWTIPASVSGALAVHNELFPSGPVAPIQVTAAPPSPSVVSPRPLSVTPPTQTLPIVARPVATPPLAPTSISPLEPIIPVVPTAPSVILKPTGSPTSISPLEPIIPVVPTAPSAISKPAGSPTSISPLEPIIPVEPTPPTG